MPIEGVMSREPVRYLIFAMLATFAVWYINFGLQYNASAPLRSLNDWGSLAPAEGGLHILVTGGAGKRFGKLSLWNMQAIRETCTVPGAVAAEGTCAEACAGCTCVAGSSCHPPVKTNTRGKVEAPLEHQCVKVDTASPTNPRLHWLPCHPHVGRGGARCYRGGQPKPGQRRGT